MSMKKWLSHWNILRSFEINIVIKNEEPLRIGEKIPAAPGTLADLVLIRIYKDGNLVPYIPGSSLKGVIRSYAEKIARARGFNNICPTIGRESCGQKYGRDLQNLLRRFNTGQASENDIISFIDSNFCIICKLFGGASYRSHIEFTDAYPIGPVRISARTGIAIDRRSGSVARGALFSYEFVEPGAMFNFFIHCTNIPNYGLGLLFEVLKLMDAGLVKIGGFKSRGCGRVSIVWEKSSMKIIDYIGSPTNGTKLLPLDDYDEFVEVPSLELSGNDFRNIADKFIEVWKRFCEKMKSKK